MFSNDSPSSSPYSARSNMASSPDVLGNSSGESSKRGVRHPSYPATGGGLGMQGLPKLNMHTHGAYPMYSSVNPADLRQHPTSPPPLQDVKPFDRPPPSRDMSISLSRANSVSGSVTKGVARSDNPKRRMEVEDLQVVSTPTETLVATRHMNLLLLQGDPQHISKQRVETAIRVIIDLLRCIPPTPSMPPPHPSLIPIIPRDPITGMLAQVQRIGTFRALRFQTGTTTKARSKKQEQAGPIPNENIAYLQAAVYMSGENGKRVYACKRCRAREDKRRKKKDALRKRVSLSESSASSKPTQPSANGHIPFQDTITGDNPDAYDPLRSGQVVQEPPWDPHRLDWRHEIVLFNSAPEIPIQSGSVAWLPFRVVCYGKCHGEKMGFRIRFTVRTHDGRVVAESFTDPIKITDDHKTDAKAKAPKTETITTHPQPAVPRNRKRQGVSSVASSRRTSPAPSEAESFQSEAGAVVQKQTPQARAGKPYERPQTHSPLSGTMPMEGFSSIPKYRRQQSSSSLHSLTSLSALSPIDQMMGGQPDPPLFSQQTHGSVSPNALRRPMFEGFTHMESSQPIQLPTAYSTVSSPVASTRPVMGDEVLYRNPVSDSNDLMSALLYQQQQQQPPPQTLRSPMLAGYNADPTVDLDMTSRMNQSFQDIFDTASRNTSISSSFHDDTSYSSFADDDASGLFSESGLVPEMQDDELQGFLDFSGGGDQLLSAPIFSDQMQGMYQPIPTGSGPVPNDMNFASVGQAVASLNHQSLAQQQFGHFASPLPQPAPIVMPPGPVAKIITIIPAEGSIVGGDKVAIIGENFNPAAGITILFGDRTAKIDSISPTFVQVRAPPAPGAGYVEVTVQGSPRALDAPPCLYNYVACDPDVMRLALKVRDTYQGDARLLAQLVASRPTGGSSEWSGSNPSGGSSGPSPKDEEIVPSPTEDDLQLSIIEFLASLDKHAPGSLRRSGAINDRNKYSQTLLHLAAASGFHRLARRLVVIGAHLDLQDVNGYTPLALAALTGQVACVRVLIEAGAAYDRPTVFGEMPLDLAKIGEKAEVESLLLSAVWSTAAAAIPTPIPTSTPVIAEPLPKALEVVIAKPPQSASAGEEVVSKVIEVKASKSSEVKAPASESEVSQVAKPKKVKKVKGKNSSPPRVSDIANVDKSLEAHVSTTPADDPPPYHPPLVKQPSASWMARTISNISHPPSLPDVWDRLPNASSFLPDKAAAGTHWVAFPVPSWESLTKLANPDEVKLFTQAMAAAAFNAVVESGATTSIVQLREDGGGERRMSEQGDSKADSKTGKKVVKRVKLKHDKMLYLFWIPVLLFVGFWAMVTAVPIATGFCLIYARQITRAIKNRVV